jgi:HAD superfamily hydrolase (TIGR01509 family)
VPPVSFLADVFFLGGVKLLGVRALLFDFDGLILDTETPEFDAWTSVFRDHGVELPLEFWVNAVGRGAEQMTETPVAVLERLTGKTFDHESIRATYNELRMTRIYAERPLPGVLDLLAETKSAGVGCAVVSSSKHAWVDAHLERLNLRHWFQHVVCAGDVPRAKPFPDLYLEALRRFEISASEAMALEDSANGARAAVDAGIFVVAVPNPVTKHLDLSHANAILPSLDGMTLAKLDALNPC